LPPSVLWTGLHKEEIIYIGDAPSDVKASREAGIAVIGAGWAPTAEPEALQAMKPDELFYSVKDLSDWLLPRT
jgi:phosphoglycolate phosphatase/pyrophosphatase PpaX